jgi:APA family basic amino acid/polyamine antiporter
MSLFATKSIPRILGEAEAGEHRLKKTLGAGQLVALGIGAIIGAGLFSMTGMAAAQNAGPAVVFSMVVAAFGCALAGLCYSEFACMLPVSGSAYTYAYATLGEWIAWIIGWDLVIEYAIGAATVSISWSAYLVSLLRAFHIELPARWIAGPFEAVELPDGMAAAGYANLPAVLIVLLVSVLLMVGMRESARVNATIVVIKLAVVLVFIGAGWSYINPANYHPFLPPNTGTFGEFGISGIMMGAGTVFFAYIGFDAVSTAAQECRNPQKDMPIGMFGSLAVCTVLYILFSVVLTGLVPYTKLGVAAPVAVAIDRTPYVWLNSLIKFGVLCGYTSVILVMLMGQSRVFYSMSRDGLVPAIFSQIHPRFRTPWRSNLLFFLFVAPFSALLPLSIVGRMTSIGTLFAFVIVCAGVWVMRVKNPGQERPFRTPWVPVIPILGMLTNFALMYALGRANWLRLAVWLVIGQAIYFLYGRRHSRLRHSDVLDGGSVVDRGDQLRKLR